MRYYHKINQWCLTPLKIGLCTLLLILPTASALEQISRFHSEITVLESGQLDVVETITVNAEHRQIKRGIYRDFPTIYPHNTLAALQLHQNVDFHLISVERNGQNEPWHTQQLTNGVRIYIGDANHFVQRGNHTYELHYRTDRQLTQTKEQDILYWNVTGQGWSFPIQHASARIHFPTRIDPTLTDGWTGQANNEQQQFRSEAQDSNSIYFETTRGLPQYNGFTIQTGIPAGSLEAPPSGLSALIKDNWRWLAGLLGLIALPIYYFKAWLKVGRDPDKGVIVADYHPVREMSPAAHRFVSRNKYDDKTFAAAVLSMAVKGWLTITQEGKKTFTLEKTHTQNKQALAAGEQRLYDSIFRSSSRVTLGKKYQANVATAKSRLKRYLRNELRDAIYMDNRRYSMVGLVISLAILVLFAWHISNGSADALAPLGVAGGLLLLISMAPIFGKKNMLAILPFAGFMLFSFLGGAAQTANIVPFIILAGTVAALYGLFYYLLRAPTPFGQKVLDEIEGFRLYLGTAEQQRLDILHPPERTPELFEKLLPYALALDVENQWAEQFADTIGPEVPEDRRYSPGWYHGGRFNHFGSSGFASAIGTGLASSVAAAATAPSSSGSSGFGGGVGGGGGGGGGGGW